MVGAAAKALGGEEVAKALEGLKSKLVEFAFGLNQVTESINIVRGAFGQFVEAFRPDVMFRFEQVTTDLLATIGENLVPVIQLATGFFKQLGDIIAGLTPQILPIVRQLTEALKPLIDQFFNFFKAIGDVGVLQMIVDIQTELWGILGSIFESIAPILVAVVKGLMMFEQVLGGVVLGVLKVVAANFQVLAFLLQPFNAAIESFTQMFSDIGKTMFDVFGMIGEIFGELIDLLGGGLVSVMNQVVESIKAVSAYFRYFINQIREFFGLEAITDNKGNSAGKASGDAKFTTTDELYKKLASATFGSGRGSEGPEVRSAGHLEAIRNFLMDDVKPFIRAYMDAKNTVSDTVSDPLGAYDKVEGFFADMARQMVLN